ncbi:MAG: hypothetical protein R3C03_20890 [Pirellulaceae bacterium]
MFYGEKVLGQELAYLDFHAADKNPRVPVVLSREEIRKLEPCFERRDALIFGLMWRGCGTRKCLAQNQGRLFRSILD